MQTSLTLSLDKRRAKKDGSYPIIIRLGHFQKTTSISTGHAVHHNYWNDKKKCVRSSYKGVQSVSFLNNILRKQLARAQEVVNKLQDNSELDFMSIKQLKSRITNQNTYDSFYTFTEDLIEELKKANRFGTARTYKDLLYKLKLLTNDCDLKFNEINYDFLKKLEQQHLSNANNSYNGLATYLRTLRAIYNKGVKRGKISRDTYPFAEYKIRTIPTKKRAISYESIKKLLTLELIPGSWPFHHRNYFLLSYMLMGMPFIDMAFLKIENIVGGRIQFKRRKTSRIYDIKITKQLETVLNFYTTNKDSENYIFPIIKREGLELQLRDIKSARKRYNKGLRELALECGIKEQLTSYVSRHSFATHALLKNVPLAAISAMLGHTKLSTTQIYLKSLPNNILDQYQEQLNKL